MSCFPVPIFRIRILVLCATHSLQVPVDTTRHTCSLRAVGLADDLGMLTDPGRRRRRRPAPAATPFAAADAFSRCRRWMPPLRDTAPPGRGDDVVRVRHRAFPPPAMTSSASAAACSRLRKRRHRLRRPLLPSSAAASPAFHSDLSGFRDRALPLPEAARSVSESDFFHLRQRLSPLSKATASAFESDILLLRKAVPFALKSSSVRFRRRPGRLGEVTLFASKDDLFRLG